MMHRREFLTLLCGAAAAWPLAAEAQQRERVRRIGVLVAGSADDSEFQARLGAFQQELQKFGWSIGRNVRIDTRWAGANAADIRRHATELAASAPDLIFAQGASTVAPLLEATRTVPMCSRSSAIRSAPASSTAWRGRAATLPDSWVSNSAWVGNGWNCSSR
jgi:putative ABC transport system substrate-binding protein